MSYSVRELGGIVRIHKVKVFARFQRHERIADTALAKAIGRAERRLVDAELGGGRIKQRVARPGQGKSGGYRMVITYRVRNRAVFLLGFAKSGKADLKPDELADLAEIGASWLKADNEQIEAALADERLKGVDYDDEN